MVNDANYDIDYSLLTVKSLHGLDTFENIKKMLQDATLIAEQLNR